MKRSDVDRLVRAGNVDGLRVALSDKHMRVRYAAINGLRDIGSAAAADALAEHAMHTEYLTTQGNAAEALEALGDARTVEAYMATVRDGWGHDLKSDAQKAAERLVDIGDDSIIAPMVDVLHANSGRPGPWEAACRVLTRAGHEEVAPTLLWVATGEPLPHMPPDAVAATRATAIEGLEALIGTGTTGFATIGVDQLVEAAVLGLRSKAEPGHRLSEMAIHALGVRHDAASRSALIMLRNTEFRDVPTDRLPGTVAAALDDAVWAAPGVELPDAATTAPTTAPLRMTESDIAWSVAQPSTLQDEQRVTLLGGDRFHPGDTVRFSFKADRWPDPKVTGLDVEVAYLSSFVEEWEAQPQTVTGQLFAPIGVQTRERSSTSAFPDRTVVAQGTIEPGALEPAGRVTGTFTLPDPCPPTIADFSRWLVEVHVHRRHGLDKHPGASLLILTGPAEQVISSRPTAAEHPSDWLHRVVGHDLGADRPGQAASIQGTAVAAPGSLLTGSVTVRPHLAAVAQMRRKARKQAEETGQVTLPGLTVALECWRGSLARNAFQRMWRNELTIVDEVTVALDGSREVPFEIALPESVPLAPTTARQPRPEPTPPTFFGSTFEAPTLDDVRWRLVTQLRTSAQHTQDPFWAMTEVLVISPPR